MRIENRLAPGKATGQSRCYKNNSETELFGEHRRRARVGKLAREVIMILFTGTLTAIAFIIGHVLGRDR